MPRGDISNDVVLLLVGPVLIGVEVEATILFIVGTGLTRDYVAKEVDIVVDVFLEHY
jgi:hypothetical protein